MPFLRLLCLAALVGCSATPANLDCPINTVAVANACRNVCQDQSDCLASEHCSDGACIAGAADDGGVSAPDALSNSRDATANPDASPDASLTRPDASETKPDAHVVVNRDAGMPVECHNRSEQSCRATPGCTAYECPTCEGSAFATCANPGEGPPPCAAPQCRCEQLDERACDGRIDCRTVSCLDCQGGLNFAQCLESSAIPMCMEVSCGCAAHTDQASCDADPVCHTLFTQVCDPAIVPPPLCHMDFSGCGDGARVICNGPVMCRSIAPNCASGYAVATDGFCYEGCVLALDCAI